jgi:hypothetical protein
MKFMAAQNASENLYSIISAGYDGINGEKRAFFT